MSGLAVGRLPLRTCTCYHLALKHNPQLYTKTFFTLESYRKTYENAILHLLTGDNLQPLVAELSENKEINDDNDNDNDNES